ncbi:MAG: ABC transporter substrate-binding protein [Dehalococcoidia bacterium]|nr:ABC transporter substrate-binding protein [Dehalococcoidia bacterium]
MAAKRSSVSNIWTSGHLGLMSRRRLLRGGVVVGAGLGAALMGCASAPPKPVPAAQAPQAPAAPGAPAERPGVPMVKGAPKMGGTWVNAVTLTSPQHDMHTALAASIWHGIGERAIQPDPWTNELRANLVEKWEIPDNTHYVLHMKKGVKLHNKPPWNGRDFDGEDLAFNINRIAGNYADAEKLPKSAFQRADTLSGMDKVEVVDKYTVRVTTAKPSSAWIKGFLEWRNLMMPKGIVETGFKDPMTFAGMAAHELTEFVPNVREVYTKFPGYHRAGQPYFDKLIHTVVPDTAAALAGFISKQFTSFGSPTPSDEKTIKAARPDALFYSTASNHWPYFWPSSKFGPFTDFRVRKALQLAIDVPELGDGFFGPGWGWTGVLVAAYPESWSEDKIKTLPGYNPATKAKDREEAQKLMAAAGFPNGTGVNFEILTEGSSVRHTNGIRLQAQFQTLFTGSKVTMKPVSDRAQFANLQTSKNFQAMSYSSVSQPDIATEAYSLYHTKGGRNYGAFSNAAADALLEKALAELNADARKELFATFQEKAFNEWMPNIGLFTQPNRAFLQPGIAGYDKAVGPWANGLSDELRGFFYNV